MPLPDKTQKRIPSPAGKIYVFGSIRLRQYRTTPVRQIARKLNKVELRSFVRVHKFDAGGLTPGKENLCAMTENMQADDVQRRKPRVVRCCLNEEIQI